MLRTFAVFVRFALAFTVIVVMLLVPVTGSLQQTQDKSRIDKFGSSLDQLNQKPAKKPAQKQPAKPTSDADGEIHLDATLAVFDVQVLNKNGQTVTGFKKEDFVVSEDGVKQDIATFASGDGTAVPRSIILILDYSPSQIPYIKTSTVAAEALVDNLGPRDKMALVTDDVSLLVDYTSDKAQLKQALGALRTIASTGQLTGKSLQFSALMASLKELLSEGEQQVIIFQTDGDQLPMLSPKSSPAFGSPLLANYSIEDVYSTVDKAHVTVYSVIPGPQLIGLPDDQLIARYKQIKDQEMLAIKNVDPADYQNWMNFRQKMTDKLYKTHAKERLNQHQALFNVAKISGGWTEYLETPDKANDIYARIFSGMNQRFVLAYYPTNNRRDGKLRKVKIEVRAHPEYVIRSRNSYYAPQD